MTDLGAIRYEQSSYLNVCRDCGAHVATAYLAKHDEFEEQRKVVVRDRDRPK